MLESTELAARCARLIRDVADFPLAGVGFKDINPLLADAPTFADVVEHLAALARAAGGVDLVAGIEARGFILGAPVATALGVGFLPIRKEGKLPGPTVSASYDLEYGSATVELQPGNLPAGARVLLVDDVLATGGTAAAAATLLRTTGAVVAGLAFLLEITSLGGRARLDGLPVDVILTVP
ncbi:adenine phosphoribosyltransferase [Cellulomonas fimi]|uniref:Adenine phosphoribosyltransferase n=1 Tax=Cellulomonas fimi TaxID=1708 RepID=A0A7Y0QIC5_CELFI|nr:adenine phosphoribosyltransferase [Cellulomonas fimi]NMR20132.1 adenine phosphoribosyltransferase [Cellulomonas fimi]